MRKSNQSERRTPLKIMGDFVTVAVVGAGIFPVLAPTLAALAMYHGERPLKLQLWDANPDLAFTAFHLARRLCVAAGNYHLIEHGTDLPKAFEGAERCLWMLDDGALNRFQPVGIRSAMARIELLVPNDCRCLVLNAHQPDRPHEFTAWPPIPEGLELERFPHQVLRWIKEDDEPRLLLWQFQQSPVSDWLNHLDA